MHVLGCPPWHFQCQQGLEAQIEELSHWSKFQLDFVIAGVDNCGTTSLGRWLQQLEEVEFSRGGEEDASLFSHDRLLPYVSEVQAFNSQWRSPSTLKGLRHPSLVGTPSCPHGSSPYSALASFSRCLRSVEPH